MRQSTLLPRAGLVGVAALALAGLSAAPALAASDELPYVCDYYVGAVEGSGDALASWDSAIPDDGSLVVDVGDSVPLDPYTGTITLPDAFVDELRTQAVTTLDVSGLQLTFVAESGEPYVIELAVDPTPVPASGPMTIDATGVDAGSIEVTEAGTNTLVGVAFVLSTDDEETGLFCDLDEDVTDPTIDTFTAEAVATPSPTVTVTVTPTPTVTVTASPVRPVLVQTDAVDGAGHGTRLAAAGLGFGALALGGAGVVARRRPARRH